MLFLCLYRIFTSTSHIKIVTCTLNTTLGKWPDSADSVGPTVCTVADNMAIPILGRVTTV